MTRASMGNIALRTAVFATVAVGSIVAVLAQNVPLGAVAGIAIGVVVVWVMWPKRASENAKEERG